MRTIIISTSLSPNSKSYLLAQAVEQNLMNKGAQVELVDARQLELNLFHQEKTSDMEKLALKITEADNIIFGMGVHCYSFNDSLKVILDGCCGNATNKFFGLLCAAGGDKSYLSTMQVSQICMNEWRMIQLPRIIYATGQDFKDGAISSEGLNERIAVFSEEFFNIGSKLLA